MVATPSAITAPQRVVASNFKVVLANVDILAADAQTLAASRRLREALKSCSQRHLRYIACCATTGQASHLKTRPSKCITMSKVTRTWSGPLMHAIAARRNVSCACFGHAQTRPEITPYPKSARNDTSNSTRNSGRATDRSLIKMRNISIKTRARSGLPVHTTAESSAHVIRPRPKTRPGLPGSFCSHKVFAMAP